MLEKSPVSHLENCIKITTTKNVGESIGKAKAEASESNRQKKSSQKKSSD